MTSLWRHLWPNYNTLDFQILTQCVKLLGERVLQVWWWYLHWFRRYRKKTRGGARNSPPQWGRGLRKIATSGKRRSIGRGKFYKKYSDHFLNRSNYQKLMAKKVRRPDDVIMWPQMTLQREMMQQRAYAWYPRRAVASFPVERSSEVTLWRHQVAVRFLPITSDINELGTWGWCHSVRLVKAHRLICIMTYLGHTVILTWRGLRSNF